MSRVGFLDHPDCLLHDPGTGHPERAERLRAIRSGLEARGLLAEVEAVLPEEIAFDSLTDVHTHAHVQSVVAACSRAPGQLDADTAVSTGSLRAARLSAGALLGAVERVMEGSWESAFVACRPPGHHAERQRAMGFCLFNNVAVAARQLVLGHGLERVAIVDFDVHHGNGTQHIFEADPTVFYASLHQFPHYPGTGAASERGKGEGLGTTLNCPMSAGTGDSEWLAAFEGSVLPALEDFRPEFLLVSAGFDAHRLDPLSGTQLTEDGYRQMTALLREFAVRHCQGRLVSVLEGGYHLDALAASAAAHVEALL